MSLLVLISIVIRLTALGCSIVVLRRIRDGRMIFLAVIFAWMALRQILALASTYAPGEIELLGAPEEVTSLALSVMALLAIFLIERLLSEQRQMFEKLRACETKYQTVVGKAEEDRQAVLGELEEKNAELERFTYTVSHDLKSPLITIRGFLGFLEKDVTEGDGERLQRDLDRIRAATETMGRLLDELLELSRIGRLMNLPEEVRLTEIGDEAVELLAGSIDAAGIEVQVDPWLPIVEGDRQRLLEVYQNLIDNAVKFMGEQPQPRIELGQRRDGDENVLYVRDNGTGIDRRYQDRIFRLFERLDPEKYDGTGIGLALVKRSVEVHGGHIWVESDGPGQGTTMCFILPVHHEASNE